jgi:hypothetical protein
MRERGVVVGEGARVVGWSLVEEWTVRVGGMVSVVWRCGGNCTVGNLVAYTMRRAGVRLYIRASASKQRCGGYARRWAFRYSTRNVLLHANPS